MRAAVIAVLLSNVFTVWYIVEYSLYVYPMAGPYNDSAQCDKAHELFKELHPKDYGNRPGTKTKCVPTAWRPDLPSYRPSPAPK